jgi:hypothetical protein
VSEEYGGWGSWMDMIINEIEIEIDIHTLTRKKMDARVRDTREARMDRTTGELSVPTPMI